MEVNAFIPIIQGAEDGQGPNSRVKNSFLKNN